MSKILKTVTLSIALAFIFLTINTPCQANPFAKKDTGFMSLKSKKVNLRSGPGREYIIKYTYQVHGMPLKILDSYYDWKKIQDYQGDTGWISKNLLSKRRMIIVTSNMTTLQKGRNVKTRPLLVMKKNVVAKLLKCKGEWCKIELKEKKGWVQKSDVWGI